MRIKVNTVYEKNLVALAMINLKLANDLVGTKSNHKYEVVIGKSHDEINIFDKERDFEPLYPSKPKEELFEKLQSIEEKSEYPYFYFFGVGNGLLYKIILSEFINLKKIFIFEPELELLNIVLSLIDFSEEIKNEKIVFLDSNTFTFDNANWFLQDIHILIYVRMYELMIHCNYYDHYSSLMQEINAILTKAFEHSIFTMGNSAEDSLVGLRHHLLNLPFVVKTPTLDELVAKGSNTDIAVIVSTGPSLTKQLKLLYEIQDYVTILCPDASFPILSRHNIVPDIVFSLERVEATSQFYKDTPSEYHKNPIFCFTSIVHRELIDSIQSQNIQINIRPFSFLTYFDTPSWGYMGFGMSAANMAYEFVLFTKFKQCTFIGQDLAYGNDGATHATEHIFGLENVPADIDTVWLDAYGGEGKVRSTPIWETFLTYFEQDITRGSSSLETFNCTEGGARIKGTKELPFSDFVNQYVLPKKRKKKRILLKKPTAKESKEAVKNYRNKFSEMKCYLEEKNEIIKDLFLKIVAYLEEIEILNKETRLEEIDFTKADQLIAELEEVKKLYTEGIFRATIYDFLKSYIMFQEFEIAKIQVRKTQNDEEKNAKKIEWLYAHRYWLFSLAGGMEAILKVTEEISYE